MTLDYKTILVEDEEGLRTAVAAAFRAGVCGLDTETTGLDPRSDRLRLVQVAVPGTVFVVDAFRVKRLSPLGDLLSDRGVLKVFQSAAFDLKFLRAAGLRGVERLFDTMLAARLLDCGLPGPGHSLGALAKDHLGVDLDKSLQSSDFSGALSREQVEYAARDAAVLIPLYEKLSEKLVSLGLARAARVEFSAVPAVADMEYAGIFLDVEAWTALAEEVRKKRDGALSRLKEVLLLPSENGSLFGDEWLVPANPNSPQQVMKALKRLGVEVENTDESSLKAVAGSCPAAGLILECRGYEKLLSSFLDKYPEFVNPKTGRIHARYDQLKAASGRFSCRDPNVQQVPRKKGFRRCFRAEGEKVFVIADFSQIELRIAAALSGDKRMTEAYKRGEDLHRLTASLVSGKPPKEVTKEERQNAKACFSGDTEVLTPDGWVRFDRYDGFSPVAQYALPEGMRYNANGSGWDGSGGRVEFVRPLGYRKFEGRALFRLGDRNVDLLLTADHEVVYVDAAGRPRKAPAKSVLPQNARYAVAAGNIRVSPELAETETRILAMVASEGSFDGLAVGLEFSEPRKVRRCLDLLRSAGAAYEIFSAEDAVAVTVREPRLVSRLLGFFSPERGLDWRCLGRIDGRIYLEEAARWGGSVGGLSKGEARFFAAGRQTAEVMQALAAASGVPSVLGVSVPRKPHRSPVYTLSYRLSGPPLWRLSWRLEPAAERAAVYCVQVPSGAILVRRNGRVSVQGNCNFGLIYGMSASGLKAYARDSYGVEMTDAEAELFRKRFFEAYSGIARWHEKQRRLREVRTRSGRLRRFGNGRIPPTELYNTPVQGTGADILKSAMARLRPRLVELDADIVACVHDEVVVECPPDAAEEVKEVVEREMAAAGEEFVPEVPIVAEAAVGKTWADKA